MSKIEIFQLCVRTILSAALLYFVYYETGIAATVFCVGVTFTVEVQMIINRNVIRFLKGGLDE